MNLTHCKKLQINVAKGKSSNDSENKLFADNHWIDPFVCQSGSLFIAKNYISQRLVKSSSS